MRDEVDVKCKHENAEHLTAGEASTWSGPLDGYVATVEQFRCIDCGAWLSLGPSNDEPEAVRIEIRLAELFAGYAIEFGIEHDDVYEILLDIFATDDPPHLRPANRPLSPIEIMVDRACGVTR